MSPFKLLLPVELVQEQEIGWKKIAQCPNFGNVLERLLLASSVTGTPGRDQRKRREAVQGQGAAQCSWGDCIMDQELSVCRDLAPSCCCRCRLAGCKCPPFPAKLLFTASS